MDPSRINHAFESIYFCGVIPDDAAGSVATHGLRLVLFGHFFDWASVKNQKILQCTDLHPSISRPVRTKDSLDLYY